MLKIAILTALTAGALLNVTDSPAEYELDGPIEITPVDTVSVTSIEYVTTVASTSTAGTSSTATSTLPTSAPDMVATYSGRCGEWATLALDAGWPEERLELLLGDVMWDESRCQPDVISGTGDYGLLQINWKTWGAYVESFGLDRASLLTPAVNLYLGLQIAEKAVEAGWRWCQPWDMSGSRSC